MTIREDGSISQQFIYLYIYLFELPSVPTRALKKGVGILHRYSLAEILVVGQRYGAVRGEHWSSPQ